MRHVDFSPLYRSTVGFDRLFTMLDSLGAAGSGTDLSALQYRAHRRDTPTASPWRLPASTKPNSASRRTPMC